MKMDGNESNLIAVLGSRGLAAAVLAQLPQVRQLPYASLFSNLILVVIMATVLYSTISVFILSRKRDKQLLEEMPKAGKPQAAQVKLAS